MASNRKSKRKTTTGSDYLLECLVSLTDTGPNGFEGLVRDLLEEWTGQIFRLAKSGSQSGKDSTSDNRTGCVIAAEMKRYQEGTHLSTRELLGELSEAATSLSNLDLWVLAATKEIGDKEARSIHELSEKLDVETLIIDTRTDGIGPIQAFCAKYPHTTLNFCIKNGTDVSADKLKSRIEDIQAHSAYSDAINRLQVMLDATTFGFNHGRKKVFQWLNNQVSSQALSWAIFRQDIALRDKKRIPPIDRDMLNQQFDDWWKNRRIEKPYCVLLGEEGTGKTWAVMSWLIKTFQETGGPIILPITSSQLTAADNLTIIIASILQNRCGKSIKFWQKHMEKWMKQMVADGPLFLLCLDGLNEKPDFPWKALLAQTADDIWDGKIAIIMTSRPEYWKGQVARGLSRIHVMETKGYDDSELKLILGKTGLTIDQVPDDLSPLIRKPRYCDLVIQRFAEMVACGDLTIERLLYEDYKDRTVRKLSHPVSDEEFSQILCSLARQHLKGVISFNKADLKSFLPVVGDGSAFLQEIIDGGLLVPTEKSSTPYRVEKRRLIHGLGMLLAEDLKGETKKSVNELTDTVQAWLEPQPDMEMKVQITGAAVFFSVVDESYPQNALRALLRTWIGARNMAEEQERAIGAYMPECADDLLAITDDFWRSSSDDGLAQERLANAFLNRRDDPRVKPKLIQAARRWMSYVNINGQHLERGNDNKKLEELTQAIVARLGKKPGIGETVIFQGRSFPVTDDDGLLRLARFALLIISGGDRLPFADAFFQWAVSRRLMGRHSEYEEADWVLRLADEDLWSAFVPTLQKMVKTGDDTMKKAAQLLLTCLGNREALALDEECLGKLYPTPEWLLELQRDPYASMFSLSCKDFESCMAREDLAIHHLVWKMDKKYLPDPELKAPESFVKRLRDASIELPVVGYRASIGHTSDDHKIEQFETALARFAPSNLGNLMRTVVQSISQRNEKSIKYLFFYLPRLGLILLEPELAILKEALHSLAEKAKDWGEKDSVNDDRYTEAEGALALIMHLNPEEAAEFILGRPAKAVDLVPLQHWFNSLPEHVVSKYLDRLLTETDEKNVGRLLWILCESKISLSDAHRSRIKQLVDSMDEILSFSALRFAWATKDKVLIESIIKDDGPLLHPEKSWVDRWFATILCHYGNDLQFDQLFRRLPLARLGWAVNHKGCLPEDIKAYALCLNSVWRNIAGCKDILEDQIIDANVYTFTDLDVSFKDYQEVPADRTVRFVSSALAWGSSPSLSPEDHKRLMISETAEQFTARRRAFYEKIVDLTKREETRWQSDKFNTDVLEQVCRYYPAMVQTWVDTVEGNKNILFLCEGFYQSLCAALVNTEPSIGFKLWRWIRRGHRSINFMEYRASTDWMTCLPFAAQPSEEAETARAELIDPCYSDIELLRLANAACAYGQQDWVLKRVRQLIKSPQLWRRAKGLMLICLADTDANIDELVSLSDIDGTWISERLPTIKYFHDRNGWAKYWYRRFLNIADNDDAFASYHLFLKCVDRRCHLWMDILETERESGDDTVQRRIKFRLTNEEQLKRAIEENEKDLKDHFLTVKYDKGQLLPFMLMT